MISINKCGKMVYIMNSKLLKNITLLILLIINFNMIYNIKILEFYFK